jgi:tetratricopeptide (TPR) repeat protein
LDLRRVLAPLAEYERVFAHLREAETLAETLGDQPRLGQVAAHMGMSFRLMGDYDRTAASCQRALAIAETLGDVALQVTATYFLGQAYSFQGDYRRAIDPLRQNLALLEGELCHAYFGLIAPPSVATRTNLVRCLVELGEFAEALTRSNEGVRLAEAIAHPTSFYFAYQGLGTLYLRQGDLYRAIPALEHAWTEVQGANLPHFFPLSAGPLGVAYTLAGRIAEAVPLLERVVQQGTATRRQDGQSLWIACLGEAYLRAGRLEEALCRAQQALKLARTYKERGHEAWILRLFGEIEARHEPPEIEEAEARYRQAQALAEALGMRPLLAHCHLGLGTLYAQSSRGEQARAALTAAIDLYRAMEMTFWLPQAEAALAQVGRQ